MNIKITRMAEGLDTVHTHTHTHTQPIFTKTVFTKKTQYEVETCNEMQVRFNMQKYKTRIILNKKVLF